MQQNVVLLVQKIIINRKKLIVAKNTIIVTMTKLILFVGQTFTGHNHDYKMLKEEFSTEQAWFEHLGVQVDLANQGIFKDYYGGKNTNSRQKTSKIQKSNPTLTSEQKEYNQRLGHFRVFIEHVIGGIKRFNILVHAFRNRKPNFIDDVIILCAGLWNLNFISNI